MSTETNQAAGAEAVKNDTGDQGAAQEENITISKKDYEILNQSIGSMKRELKDLKQSKPKEETQQTSKSNTPDEISALKGQLENMALRQAGLSHQDDMELARKTAKKWGTSIEEVLGDEDFKVKLERQQTQRSNVEATADVKGGSGATQAKNSPEYWAKLGRPPSREEVPDSATRRKIARSFLNNKGTSKKFYND